jgi:hypothetical protein
MAEPPTEPEPEGADSKRESEKPDRPMIREPQIPPAAANQSDAKKDRDYRLELWKFRVEILTLVAVIIYAYFAYRQWDTISDQLRAYQMAEGAYLGAGWSAPPPHQSRHCVA